MVSMSRHPVYYLVVLIVWSCLLAASQANVNVALNKPAYIQNQYHRGNERWDASNAVDGRKSDLRFWGGQCAVSTGEQTATWWVNLTSIHSIHHITIYFRTENQPWGPSNWLTKYFLGFSVYVSNTTDRLQGTLCYKDDNFTLDTIPAVFTTTCPVHGQYVIYYNERLPGATYPDWYSDDVYSGLCELEVYGCPGGFYGTNCAIACPDTNCYCNIETGICQVCKPGYQSYLCKLACDKRSYGLGCSESCGQCRDVDKCLNTNGTCLTGCSAGYRGHTCHTPCGRGLYGAECQQKCGHCRDITQCVHTNGSCLTGCEAGYNGEMCTEACPYGFFGLGCADRCKDTCDGCNNINGSCDSGCNPGWQGNDCQYACEEGSFGDNCSETCGHCRDINQCSNINGKCLTGCAAGHKDDLCKTRSI